MSKYKGLYFNYRKYNKKQISKERPGWLGEIEGKLQMIPEEAERFTEEIEQLKGAVENLWNAIEEDRAEDELSVNEMERLTDSLEKDFKRIDKKFRDMEDQLTSVERKLSKWKTGAWILLVLGVLVLLSVFGWRALITILIVLFDRIQSVFGY